MIPSDIFFGSEVGKHGKTTNQKLISGPIMMFSLNINTPKGCPGRGRQPRAPGVEPLPSMLRWPPFLALLHVAFARQCLRAGHGCELMGVDGWWLLFFPIYSLKP